MLFPGQGRRPIDQTLDQQPEVTRAWKARIQQIFPADAVALVIATWSIHQELRNVDVTWFIDNEAAAAAGIRGASKEPDHHHSSGSPPAMDEPGNAGVDRLD